MPGNESYYSIDYGAMHLTALNDTPEDPSQITGDETTFLSYARLLAGDPIGHGWWPHAQYPLHTVLFAFQIKAGGFSEGAMRVTSRPCMTSRAGALPGSRRGCSPSSPRASSSTARCTRSRSWSWPVASWSSAA